MQSVKKGEDHTTKVELEDLNNPRIADFLQVNPLLIHDYEKRIDWGETHLSADDFTVTAYDTLFKTISVINNNLKSELPLMTFSCTCFKTGRVNRMKPVWEKLLQNVDQDPLLPLLSELLNSKLDLSRFLTKKYEIPFEMGQQKIKWVKCDRNIPLPLTLEENDWVPCHDLSIRAKQYFYQSEMDQLILELAACGIIHIVGDVDRVDRSFFRLISPLHVVLEKRLCAKSGTFTTRIRVTLDAKIFNKSFEAPSFYLLTGAELQHSLKNFQTASSYDLRKSFYNVLPCPEIQGFTGFRWRNFLGFFNCAAFGLSLSPFINYITTEYALKVFYSLLKTGPVLRPFLHCLTAVYVDDYILTSIYKNPKQKISAQDKLFITLMTALGFTLNSLKSDPISKNRFQHLGLKFRIDRKLKQVFTEPTDTQVENLRLNLAQALTSGNFRTFTELDHPSWINDPRNRKRFFANELNHNLLEKITGNLLLSLIHI